jgi:hypothetical protein
MPVKPGSIRNSEGSTKDLKPISRRRVNCIDTPLRAHARGGVIRFHDQDALPDSPPQGPEAPHFTGFLAL